MNERYHASGDENAEPDGDGSHSDADALPRRYALQSDTVTGTGGNHGSNAQNDQGHFYPEQVVSGVCRSPSGKQQKAADDGAEKPGAGDRQDQPRQTFRIQRSAEPHQTQIEYQD